MKKIIDGKLYNTETAEEVCGYEYSNRSDFNYCQETLYRTAKGAYFIHGEGGPRSKYARSTGQNEISGGESIRVMTLEEAKEFTEAHASADIYVECFGEVEEA